MFKLVEMKLPYIDPKKVTKYTIVALVILMIILLHSVILGVLGYLIGEFLLLCYELAGLLDKIIFGG